MKLLISAAALLQAMANEEEESPPEITHGPDEDTEWTYNLHGSDWSNKVWETASGNDVNECGDGPQAPLDLLTYGSDGFHDKFKADSDDLLESAADKFTFDLYNLVTFVGWDFKKAAYGFDWGDLGSGCYGASNAVCQADSA